MQFKHPELLYALLLLLIPIIVHLFQLRRFQKEAFTNVKFLREVVLQTRKSSQLKKWLTLLTRLGIIACAVLAFAEPYFSNKANFNTKSETVIYLDNSFSMQAKGGNGSLLNEAIQDIITYASKDEKITLFTNSETFSNTTVKAIQNELIALNHVPKQLSYESIVLKGKQSFSNDASALKNLVIISDFQQQDKIPFSTIDSTLNTSIVALKPTVRANVSIDSVFISKTTVENFEITVNLSNQNDKNTEVSVALYNNENLISKSAAILLETTSLTFTIPTDSEFKGKLTIEDPNLTYDNALYFNISRADLINVLAINETDDEFLKKIFTNDEFNYKNSALNELNFNIIPEQNLIVLNEIKTISVALASALKSFTDNGGKILIVPSSELNLNSYNQMFVNFNISTYSELNPTEKRITDINFSHPLLVNVFDKKVNNFQYPKVNSFFTIKGGNTPTILGYEDGTPFLFGSNNLFVFSAALTEGNSNFKNSPLIVPVLYNIGKTSLKLPRLYYTINETNTIDIKASLLQDDILSLNTSESSVIPLQRNFTNKIELTTNEFPLKDGWIDVKNKEEQLKTLSYNYDRSESQLRYYDVSNFKGVSVTNSVGSAINEIKSASNVNELWKWFVIFALAFLVIEMLLLKFLR